MPGHALYNILRLFQAAGSGNYSIRSSSMTAFGFVGLFAYVLLACQRDPSVLAPPYLLFSYQALLLLGLRIVGLLPRLVG